MYDLWHNLLCSEEKELVTVGKQISCLIRSYTTTEGFL